VYTIAEQAERERQEQERERLAVEQREREEQERLVAEQREREEMERLVAEEQERKRLERERDRLAAEQKEREQREWELEQEQANQRRATALDLDKELRKNRLNPNDAKDISEFVSYRRHGEGYSNVPERELERINEYGPSFADVVFFRDYSYSVSRADTNTFELSIDTDIAHSLSISSVSFPMRDVRKTSGNLVWFSGVRFSVSGDADNIRELVRNEKNYRARVYFTNLRSDGGRPKANVHEIEIFRISND
jgi:hypothetical protein